MITLYGIVESADGETEYEVFCKECHPDGEVCCDRCLHHNGFDIYCNACIGEEEEYDNLCPDCKVEVDGLADDIYWIAHGRL